MDAPQAASVSGSDLISVLQSAGFAFATVDLINAGPLAQLAALQATVAQLAAQVAVIQARPEEVAHFTGAASVPTAAVGASFTLIITGLKPAVAGDALKPGEQVVAWPTGKLPAGIDMGPPAVLPDGTVGIPCTALAAIAVAAPAVPFAVAALR